MSRLTILSGLLLPAIDALARDVRCNFHDQADFPHCRTSRRERRLESVGPDDITRIQSATAVNAELAREGFTKCTVGDADPVFFSQVTLMGTKAIDEHTKPKNRHENMAKADEKLLRNYPPKKRTN